jgi:hypothetical protein
MARFTQLLTLCALVLACAADVNELGRLAKRQIDEAPAPVPATLVPFPPQLNEQESVIVNSFRPASVASSSYYYTHGLHLAGTNKSMAQWTATRWAENGFKSRLIEYCKALPYPQHGLGANRNRCLYQLPGLTIAVPRIRKRHFHRLQPE